MDIDVIIPAYNEECSIAKVIQTIDKKLVRKIIVIDNGSTDNTSAQAMLSGAKVIKLKKSDRGYGGACLYGIRYIQKNLKKVPDIIVFIDANYSDFPEQIYSVVEPIILGMADFVVGSRSVKKREKGSMALHQIFGNKLIIFLINLFWGGHFTDLGPFRAIKFDKLLSLNMCDLDYG